MFGRPHVLGTERSRIHGFSPKMPRLRAIHKYLGSSSHRRRSDIHSSADTDRPEDLGSEGEARKRRRQSKDHLEKTEEKTRRALSIWVTVATCIQSRGQTAVSCHDKMSTV